MFSSRTGQVYVWILFFPDTAICSFWRTSNLNVWQLWHEHLDVLAIIRTAPISYKFCFILVYSNCNLRPSIYMYVVYVVRDEWTDNNRLLDTINYCFLSTMDCMCMWWYGGDIYLIVKLTKGVHETLFWTLFFLHINYKTKAVLLMNTARE